MIPRNSVDKIPPVDRNGDSGSQVSGARGQEHRCAGHLPGFATAYDADTEEEAWKFYIVTGNPADGFESEAMEMAAETSTGEWWKHGGGYATLGGAEAAELGWSYRRQMRRLITFSLDGQAGLPGQPSPLAPQPIEANFPVDKALAEAGAMLFERGRIEGFCRYCHGMGAISGGAAPDLWASAAVLDRAAFDRIVRGGALTHAGISAFADLSEAELNALQHHIRRQADAALAGN